MNDAEMRNEVDFFVSVTEMTCDQTANKLYATTFIYSRLVTILIVSMSN